MASGQGQQVSAPVANPHAGYDVDKPYQVPAGMDLDSPHIPDYLGTVQAEGWSNPPIEPQAEEEVQSRPPRHIPTGASVAAGDAIAEEDGRTYHGYKEGGSAYFLPNDGEEQDRLDLQHHAYKTFYDGRLFHAPIQTPFKGNVLDIGTGTGIWALEFAEQNPDANVIGADLSAIQPGRLTALNCTFIKQDVQDDPWILGPTDAPFLFDFVFARFMYTCFDNHLRVLQNAFKNMAPGGWIEYEDMLPVVTSPDGTHEGTVVARAVSIFVQGGIVSGRDFSVPTRYKDLMAEAGFVDIVEKRMQAPFGTWPADPKQREAGKWFATDGMMFASAMGKTLRKAGMTEQQVKMLPEYFEREFRNRNLHFTLPQYIVYGRKPFESKSVPT